MVGLAVVAMLISLGYEIGRSETDPKAKAEVGEFRRLTDRFAKGPTVWEDPQTGCRYLAYDGALTPRITATAQADCRSPVPAQ